VKKRSLPLLAIALWASLGWAVAASPEGQRRYRIADLDRKAEQRTFMRRVADALPVWLLLVLGLRYDNVKIEGSVGPVTVTAGETSSPSRAK
jgi:hypothetical protein